MSAPTPQLTLHVLPPSHPCMTAEAALRRKGLDFEKVAMRAGPHIEEMQAIYGDGHHTVPGLVVDGEPVHTSLAILERLESMVPDPTFYPEPIAGAVHDAERWGDAELQDLGRRLPWGALHFRPEAMGRMGGGEALDPAGTDRAIRYTRIAWEYHRISAERLAADLAGFPEKLDHVAALVADGIIGGDEPNAADFQIGATLRVLLTVEDLHPLLDAHPGAELARRWFPDYPGLIPAGAYPAGWVPVR